MSSTLSEKIAVAHRLAEVESRLGFLTHLQHVVIDSVPEPALFRHVARDWQWAWARMIAPALEAVMGLRSGYQGPERYWRTLARGHDKTTGLGRIVNYALGHSRRDLEVYVAAADRDQAALITDSMRREARLNPWLGRKLAFKRDHVTGPGGRLTVLTSDAPSSAGLRPDLIVMDEVTHWANRQLWDMLMTAAGKRDGCIVVVITNAGVKGSWQWDVKEEAKSIPRWDVYDPAGRLDTWMSEARVADDARLVLPSEAKRLYYNQWIDPAEVSGYLTRGEMLACEELGRSRGLVYRDRGLPGLEYWSGLDYAPKRDRTALSVLHQALDGVVEVDRLDVWQGSPERPVPLSGVRQWALDRRQGFRDLSIVADKYELEHLIQEFERQFRIERFEPRGGIKNYEMMSLFRTLVVGGQLAVYPGCGWLATPDGRGETLVDEVASLVTKPMSYGYRVDHEGTKHDDRFVALGMPLISIFDQSRPAEFKRPPAVEPPSRPDFHSRIFAGDVRPGLYGLKQSKGRTR